MTSTTRDTIQAVKRAISAARMETYEAACKIIGEESLAALELYAWNAKVSGALMTPLQVCEVTVRNAVADALDALYGPLWPWSATFERSLPAGPMVSTLRQARDGCSSACKVIPELSFHFWQRMFTSRYDVRIWQPHLLRVFPNLDATLPVCLTGRPFTETSSRSANSAIALRTMNPFSCGIWIEISSASLDWYE
ncbi:hypothetical protein [Cupriavidus plantarum]|uniref:hypothetical protein n=1 Tax=Cupriavidus plantarum TaxID=942865 RepID=UPI000E37BA46|nr:hypothetical protein [Cupriavidus plantarum]REE90741.1 hypothetical protein C7418_4036 [Cupriavidus plantarum]